jgi:hypothetical protein
MDDLGSAGTREPDLPVVLPAIQIPTPLVLSDEGHQGGEDRWHGAGRLPQRWRRATLEV